MGAPAVAPRNAALSDANPEKVEAAGDAAAGRLGTVSGLFRGKDRTAVGASGANALGNLGARRESAVTVLYDMLASGEKNAHAEAGGALRKLGSEELRVPPMTGAL